MSIRRLGPFLAATLSVIGLFALPAPPQLSSNHSGSAKQPIVETDLLKVQKVTEIQAAPDGAFAVFAVLSIHSEPAAAKGSDPVYSYRTNLWFIDLRTAGFKPVPLTTGDRTDTELAISPDGAQLAFVRADAQKHPQVWLMPLRTPGEPRMVTTLEHGAAHPSWRKDGRALLVSSEIPLSQLPGKPTFNLERPRREWPDENRAAAKGASSASSKAEANPIGNPDGDLHQIRDWLEHNSAQNNPSDLTRIAFLGELALNNEMTMAELFRVDLSSEPRTTQLTFTFRSHNSATFSPDGQRILFAGLPPSAEHPDRIRDKSIIWETSADGSNEHPLIQQKGYSFTHPQFTPDGNQLLVTGVQNDQPTYRQAMLALCDPKGSGPRWITKDGEPAAGDAQVSPDGSNVYYTVESRGGEPLRRVDLRTGKTEEVITGPIGVNAFALAGREVIYAQINAENPNELYVSADANGTGGGASPRRLTELNAAWLENKEVSLPEEHWITRPDGIKVQYWVMKPTGAQSGKQYPWVLDIHGGPSAMWGPGEFTMWHEFQMFCSFGYGVVYSNPRGSAGYGYSFERANYQDWGKGPMGDIVGAVDDASVHYPMINKSQLFVTGGSYGGYMTAWMIGHTNRFQAAAALRGVYDLSTFFGEGNAYQLVPTEFGGYPWDPGTRKLLDGQSPITHVAAIKTPLLIIHGSSDNRTGIVQGQMLFRALKQLNQPVEYIRYPGAGHELTRSGEPRQRMDHMLRILEFFERYTQNPQPVPHERLAESVSTN